MTQHRRLHSLAIAGLAAIAVSVPPIGAQTATAPAKIPIRTLGPVQARTTQPLQSATSIRALSDGRMLVSDFTARQIRLFDASLSSSTIVADTTASAPIQYGNRGVLYLMRFSGDSTVIVDQASQSLVVLDPNGKSSRIMAAPRPSDLPMISTLGAAFDPQGRVVYRGRPVRAPRPPAQPGEPVKPQPQPDSVPILRADFDTRAVDTVAQIKTPKQIASTISLPGGGMMTRASAVPLPVLDDFVVMPDGTIAIVRSQDYHVDWYEPDGDRVATGKMAFDWRRLTDDDKQRVIDSTTQVAAEAAAARAAENAKNAAAPAGAAGAGGRGAATVEMGMVAVRAAGGGGGGSTDMPMPIALPPEMLAAMTAPPPPPQLSDLPDYYPPIRAGLLRADLDGNLWVLPTTSAQAKDGLLYDVVNRKGEIVQRVQLPAARTILGFGPGVVYLGGVDATGTFVERVQLAGGSTIQ